MLNTFLFIKIVKIDRLTIIDDEVTCECTQYQDLYKEGGRFFQTDL